MSLQNNYNINFKFTRHIQSCDNIKTKPYLSEYDPSLSSDGITRSLEYLQKDYNYEKFNDNMFLYLI